MLQTRTRIESPARWQKAAERAIAEGVQVRQLSGSGQWIATSGSDASAAYELAVTGAVAHGCDCLAALNGDPCCKHRAAYYLLVGALTLTPKPVSPAPGVAGITFVRSGDIADVFLNGAPVGRAHRVPDGWAVSLTNGASFGPFADPARMKRGLTDALAA